MDTSTFRIGTTDEGWQRALRLEEVWGTVVILEVRGESLLPDVENELAEAAKFLHQVDDWFSTYRIDTPISALRMGFAELSQMPEVIQQVLEQCAEIRDLTGGAFDPWAVPGGVDPSGYVKGWAADVVADRLVKQGFENVSINAAGDLSCRGLQAPDQPWVVGIRNPFDDQAIIGSAEVFNTSMATSGAYERGKHIVNPFTNDRKLNLVSASVIGPDGGLADALATALLIVGLDGVQWFKEFPGWSGFLIDADTVHTFGPAFAGLDASL